MHDSSSFYVGRFKVAHLNALNEIEINKSMFAPCCHQKIYTALLNKGWVVKNDRAMMRQIKGWEVDILVCYRGKEHFYTINTDYLLGKNYFLKGKCEDKK